MFEIILHYLVFIFIIYSNGLFIQSALVSGNKIDLNFFEQSIIGLIGTGFIALLINFFFPLSDLFIYLNLIIGLIFIFFLKIKLNLIIAKIQNFLLLYFFY